MTIIVTGGAGFIGSNYLYYTLDAHPEDRVVCLDQLTYAGNLNTLKPILHDDRLRFARVDICDRQQVFQLFEEEKPDAVIHFAAESHVDRSIREPGLFTQVNVMGTCVLLDACRAFRVPRFHQVSTDEVYGDLPLDRPDLLFTEDSPLRPSSPYSASKAGADLAALAYARTFGLHVTVSRCSNNYGPCQFPEKLIPLMVVNALNDRPLPVYGTGKNVRDWLHVQDHCRAIDSILRHGRPGDVYNVGGHSERSNLDIVRAVLRALEKPDGLITFVADRQGHDLRYAIDPGKLERELHWTPDVPFQEGLSETIRWYRDRSDWCEPILSGDYRIENERLAKELIR